MRERALDELVGLDQLAASAAQLGDLALELLAPLVEVGEHALAQRARLADDLLGPVARGVLGLAGLRLDRLLRGGAQLARGLLRLAHHPPGVLLGLVPQLDRRLAGLAEHAGGLLTEGGDEVLVGGREHRLAQLLLELAHPRGRAHAHATPPAAKSLDTIRR